MATVCPECGSPVSAGDKKCNHCGSQISVCPGCGRVFLGDPKTCPLCGSKMAGGPVSHSAPAASSGHSSSGGSSVCPDCGSPVSVGDIACRNCGSQISVCPGCNRVFLGGVSTCPICGSGIVRSGRPAPRASAPASAPAPAPVSRAPAVAPASKPDHLLKTNRGLLLYIVFTVLTLGIYALYFTHAVAHDLNAGCKDGKHTQGLIVYLLLSAITFGIYTFVWGVLACNRMANRAEHAGKKPAVTGLSWFLWSFLGAFILIGPLVAQYKLIHGLNQANEIYNLGM